MIKNRLMENRLFSKVVAMVLATSMIFATGMTSVSHAEEEKPVGEIKKIDAPLEDGVYYTQVDLWNASSNQASMGNQALRGSESYKKSHPEDEGAYDKAIVVVEDGKATALLEYMPMGFIGMYGFLMEFDELHATNYQQWGGIYEGNSHLQIADILSIHKTSEGKTVYDAYNDPSSDQVFNGGENHARPAVHDYEGGKINIADVPYPHLMAVDCTPIAANRKGNVESVPETIDEYGVDNYPYVHVFVPVMFTIMPTSGDQDARLKVDWKGAEKIENPDEILEYRLYKARQIEKGIFTGESYDNLQNTIASVTERLNNVWPAQKVTLSGGQPKAELHNFTAEEKAAMVKELDDAEKALKITGADYSKVNEAVKNVPEDLSRYTDETAKAVKDALDAVNYDLTVNEQEEVDMMADKINAAVKALVLKPEPPKPVTPDKPGKTDPSELENGTYLVKGSMVKTDRVSPSMSNGAINHNIRLTVEDGKYYVTMDFDGVSYLGKHGYLSKLSYYKTGFTLDKYGKPQGELGDVRIDKYQLDKDGKRVVDEYGTDYPDIVTFELVKEALEDGFAPLQVFVPVMESISEGAGTQPVYLKLNWDTVEKVSADDERFDKNIIEHKLLDGDNQVISKATDKVSFRMEGEPEDLLNVFVDSKLVDPSDYKVTKGSVVVTFNDDFIKTLEAGKHSVTFGFKNGETVQTAFTITDEAAKEMNSTAAPKTGDENNLYGFMMLMLAAGTAAVVLKKKADKQNR